VSALRRVEDIALPGIVRVLRRLPYSASEGILIGLSLGKAVHDHRRIRRAYAWAARGGAGGRSRWAVVLGLLVHRARALAASPVTALLDPERVRQRLEVRGLDHLEEARRRGGVILLGFHVGILIIHRFLALLGYEVTAMGASGWWIRGPSVPAPWQAVGERSPTHVWSEDAPGSRADALYRLRQAAVSGGIVMIMASGGQEGRVLFDLPLPGGPLSIRAGWFVLRRVTGLPTLPVLCHLEGGRRVVTIHPALPAPDPDERRDRDACRAALNPILEEFVARFPEQCVYLAMDIDA
jgi:lauroyl/myristoyl acyltransferase